MVLFAPINLTIAPAPPLPPVGCDAQPSDSTISNSILSNDIHIYPIDQALITTSENFGIIFNTSNNTKQDFGLQAWISTDIWGLKNRTMLTRANDDKSIRMLTQNFLDTNGVTLEALKKVYHGAICIFDQNDPDIYLHIKNDEGQKLNYRLRDDTELMDKYVNDALGLPPQISLSDCV